MHAQAWVEQLAVRAPPQALVGERVALLPRRAPGAIRRDSPCRREARAYRPAARRPGPARARGATSAAARSAFDRAPVRRAVTTCRSVSSTSLGRWASSPSQASGPVWRSAITTSSSSTSATGSREARRAEAPTRARRRRRGGCTGPHILRAGPRSASSGRSAHVNTRICPAQCGRSGDGARASRDGPRCRLSCARPASGSPLRIRRPRRRLRRSPAGRRCAWRGGVGDLELTVWPDSTRPAGRWSSPTRCGRRAASTSSPTYPYGRRGKRPIYIPMTARLSRAWAAVLVAGLLV